MNKERILYADILKIIASIAVVMIHVASIQWYVLDTSNIKWFAMNIYDSLCRWAVPVFIMISGMLFLSPHKKITIKELFFKYILRIGVLLIVWEFIYAIINQINSGGNLTVQSIIGNMLLGQYHLYYLYILIGLYLITPIIKVLINSKNEMIIKYFLMLWIILQILIYTIGNLVEVAISNNTLQILFDKMRITVILGYVGYYILGYYLSTKEYSKKSRMLLYVLGIVSCIMTIVLTKWFDKRGMFYDTFSAMTFIEAISIFVFVRQVCSKLKISETINAIVSNVTKLTLGVYIVHPIFITIIKKFDIMPGNWNVFISVPIIVILVYGLSFFTTYVISKIPVIKKLV